MKFSIIIPNYNSSKWIEKCLSSIVEQTYKDYEVIIVDDMSTDDSLKKIDNFAYQNVTDEWYLIKNEKKKYNGGTRNIGVQLARGEYIIFLDCDDWFYREDCLEQIAKTIKKNHNPDCVRLSYHALGRGQMDVRMRERNLKELVDTVFVAPWTKCIKRELFVPFPENTLIEDVVQHIAQVDNLETLAHCPIPIVVWNRRNTEAISADNRVYDRDSKRYSSIYRNVADLLDLRCKHDYCENQRQKRINWYLDKIHTKQENGIVNRA